MKSQIDQEIWWLILDSISDIKDMIKGLELNVQNQVPNRIHKCNNCKLECDCWDSPCSHCLENRF